MKVQLSTKDWQLLSEYLDDQLSPADRSRLEQRLRDRIELKTALEELRRTRTVLRSVPRRKVPHNFTLTHAMVAEYQQRRSLSRWFPVLSFSSALAVMLLVFVLFFQSPSLAQSTAALPAAAPAMEKSAPQAAGAARDQSAQTENAAGPTPMILLWGPQDYSAPQVDGRGGSGGGMDTFGSAGPSIAAPQAQDAAPQAAQKSQEQANPGILSAPVTAPTVPVVEAPAMQPTPVQPGLMAEATAAPAAPAAGAAPAEEGAPQAGQGAVEPTAEAQALAAPTATPFPLGPTEAVSQDALATPLEGNGPILGVAPESERGRIASTENLGSASTQNAVQPRRAPLDLSWRLIEITLGTIALGAGVAAFWLWRRSRG